MDLSGLLLAVLDVAVLLSSLGTGLHLKLANPLRLGMTVLLLGWEGEDIGRLLILIIASASADASADKSADRSAEILDTFIFNCFF